MAIDYDFYEAGNLRDVKREVYARPVGGQTIDTDQLAELIEHSTTASRADIKLVLSALAHEMGNQLKQGNHIKLDDLGIFKISMAGEVEKDRNGKYLLKDPRVRNVKFKPCATLMNKLAKAEFSRKRHLGHHSNNITEDDVRRTALELTENGGTFTARKFTQTLGITYLTARKWLKLLLADGTLRNIGARNCAVYTRGE